MFFYDFPVIGTEYGLPLYLLSVGLNEWQYHVIDKVGDSYNKILYSTKGNGVLIIDGTRYEITGSTAFFIPAGCPHEYYTVGDEWDTHWVIPGGYAIDKTLSHLGFTKPEVFTISDIKYLDHCFRKMHDSLMADKVSGNYRASGYLYSFLIELSKVHAGHEGSSYNPVITKACDYINSNITNEITLDDICEFCNVSKQHLCRLFGSYMKCSPMIYLTKCRLQYAKQLLNSTNDGIEEIALKSGFCTGSYFCKLFRRYEGITPTEFRKN